MDSQTFLNLGLVLVFVLVGGVFAATEIALVSLRDSQLVRLERQGARGARVAAVARDPNRFLAAVQIGVTVAGFFSAAYGGSTLAPDLAPHLQSLGLPAEAADTTALVVMTLVIAYLSLVLGELVPKRLALQRSAGLSLAVAPPLDRFATLMRPVIALLSASTNVVVRLLGGDPSATGEQLSEEELRDIVATHEGLGEQERRILRDVFQASRTTLKEVMRPRGEVEFLAADLPLVDAVERVRTKPWSRYPVTGAGFDDVLGFLHVRDLLGVTGDDPRVVGDVRRDVLMLPATNKVLPSVSTMRQEGVHLAVVIDEYGGTDGIATLEDLVEELVGEIRDEYDATEPRTDDIGTSSTVDAGITIEEFAETTGLELQDGSYETVAGYLISRLGRIPRVGDSVDITGARLEVTQMAGMRVAEVRVLPARRPGPDLW
ncbi:hemolysin family protein [Nocardioides sp. MAHUQ-72]|uniref:hemolysin family protein n=1 Tax=unclassified Nocardioides TaxID=2615069 RepID=UPI00360E577B